MTLEQARWRLLLIYEWTAGYKVSEANLEDEQRYVRLKEATHGAR